MTPIQAPPGVDVRPMRAEDIERVVGIETAAFSNPWSVETFTSLLGRPGLELLVLEDERNGVVGYAVLWCVVDQGEIANLAVAENLRGRGLGSFLLRRVLRVAKQRGVEEVFLEVRPSNLAALAMYRGHGFVEVGRRKGYYDHPKEDALIMSARP